MKRFFLIVICFSTTIMLSQNRVIINLENFEKKKIHYGYFLGLNTFKYDFKYSSFFDNIKVTAEEGFSIGPILDVLLVKNLNFRFEPTFTHSKRVLYFSNFEREIDAKREVKSSYMRFPLLLKYSSNRIGNVKPYIVGGLSTALNLNSRENSNNDNSEGEFRTRFLTYYYEIGTGVDFYLQFFKCSISIRGIFGLGNELVYDDDKFSKWTSNIESMQTRGFLIGITFE